MDDGWTSVLDAAELLETRLTRVPLGETDVLLFRTGGEIFAIAARCTHAGMPLERGPVKVSGGDAVLTCPAHGSQFRVQDGRVLRGPARDALQSYDLREVDGRIELRPR